ncbi:MAG TPA: carboxypeptidase regulatory-like domain-containing protein [Bacteroidia bacterium]|jgi:hypothetical protein|nr:carboxypeptidase regulatory-like domain-containing protein [Bacteroidia bacterium]
MLKKIRLSVLALLMSGMAYAQSTGSIIVTVTDAGNKSTLPFASVVVTKGGTQIGGGQTDINGEVEIKPLDPGQYDVQAVYAGYNNTNITNVDVPPNIPVHLVVKMTSTSVSLGPVDIVYHKPAVDPSGHVGNSYDKSEIQENADKGNYQDMVGMMTGFSHSDLGQPLHASGTRSEDNQVIIDGMKITADQNGGGLPQGMIGEINTYISGVPAKYGDATGGIIEINTINASPKLFGSAEAITSEGLDAFGYNDFNFVVGGPIWAKRDSAGKKSPNSFPSLNFILGGEYSYQQDATPSFVGGYYVNSSTLQSLQNNPLVVNPLGGFNRSAEYITDADIYHSNARQNDASQNISGNGKLDFRVNNLVTITAGGSYQYTYQHDFESVYELFNSIEDPLDITTAYRGFIRLRQRFVTAPPDKDGKPALIQNAYYTLQAEYGNTYNVVENTNFKGNVFDYGYVGQFNQLFAKGPSNYTYEANGAKGPGYYQTNFNDSTLTYKPGTLNPLMANYTSDVYNAIGEQNINNLGIVEQNLGLMNGDAVSNVYSLWYNTGRSYPSYYESNSNHFRFTANFSATIRNNDIQVGFEYEQNILSSYSLSAPSLWSIMRNNTNLQISQIDLNTADATPLSPGSDYFSENRVYNAALQTQFDKSLRQKLGLPVNGTQFIDPDNYNPSMYSLSMFSASDLLNNGSSIVSYSGYNYAGQLENTTPTIDDFFNAHDANGNLTYPIAPYHPIYIAGYLQDHFEFKSLRFDVGVRVDRFDANQPVLKDPYLLYPAKTIAEVKGTSLGENIPTNLSNNDVVYVNNAQSPTQIVGYRNGSTWYNASGDEISDPTVIASATSNGSIQPYLENPNQSSVGANAFTTYTPTVNIMPRIAFSFPISDMAGFFAHYDILTSRPPGVGYNIFSPTQYLFINSNIGSVISNPALKPVQTTDYELGFTQALNEKRTTALTLSAFYRAPKDEIETYRFLDAYPVSYLAYNNIDFGTIKGLTLAYTLSRIGDFKMRAAYTLQFATGTGSGPNSGYNLANSGNPNLQIPIPLDFDQRHNIQVNLDYHFQSGEGQYDGPIIKTHSGKSIEILSNAGINVNFVATSGTPYTVQGNATEGDPNAENVGIGIAQHYSLVGSVNGSNLPWQYRVDLKVDKDFPLTFKGKDKDKEGHKCDLMVYLAVTNLMNTENILNVYHYTGSPTDDGFLASAQGQLSIAGSTSPQAFVDQYKIKEQDPTYLSLPRTIRLGVQFNF